MPVKGTYLAVAGGGILLLWSGLNGKRWSDVLRSIIAGKKPSASLTAYTIQGTPGTAFDTASIGGNGLASDFAQYVGRVPYKWGGGNPAGWDCSGAYNYTANHDMGISIPGYAPHTFTGQTHGPPTVVYMAWLPGHATRVNASQVTADDICLWQTHMGVATSNTEYVSAYDTQDGTCIKPIHGGGPIGEIATFWRMK